MDEQIELRIDGRSYGGWKNVRISRGVEQLAGDFTLGVTERWPRMLDVRAVRPGERCEVLIDGAPVVTGWVDAVSPRYDGTSHQVTITGRDATGDLVDCSAIAGDGRVSGSTLAGVARILARPFGIPVVVMGNAGATPLPGEYALEQGETVFEALERAAKFSGALLFSDGHGRLVIGNAGDTRAGADLVEGANIMRASAEWSWRDRFSSVTVKGQSAGDDQINGTLASEVAGSAADAQINRYRPLVVTADTQAVPVTAAARAAWEVQVRRGRGARATVSVSGFYGGDRVWTPNTLVHLRSAWLNADRDMLISRVTYMLDEQGRRSELELTLPESFASLSERALKPKKGRRKDNYEQQPDNGNLSFEELSSDPYAFLTR